MRWDDFRRSDNVEDDRDGGGGGFGGGGGGFGIPVGGGGLGIGTIVVLGIVGYALGIDPRILIGGAEMINGRNQQVQVDRPSRPGSTPTDQTGKFVSAILGSTEDVWSAVFQQSGKQYTPARLVLFRGAIRGGCGMAQSAMGPFYCPNDKRVYLDTAFFDDLRNRFKGCSGNACEFSEAYVIAHEIGHHVQDLLGILPKVQRAQQASGSKRESNRLQVRVELQADCLAGVWANKAQAKYKFLDPGDIDAALQTASAIGDDRLQKQAQGYVVPDAFTHGSSAQRKQWFSTGFEKGTVSSCNTFSASL
ncbi:MAG TPA: neutral zinc metallopeptidase [Xanthobacteraceae bacterium]|jgi:predicted metalloprotease|nr:neutral zinc metallopeptidase [Xanthobacteraceae bacterium]